MGRELGCAFCLEFIRTQISIEGNIFDSLLKYSESCVATDVGGGEENVTPIFTSVMWHYKRHLKSTVPYKEEYI